MRNPRWLPPLDKLNIVPYGKNKSKLSFSETTEPFERKHGCIVPGIVLSRFFIFY